MSQPQLNTRPDAMGQMNMQQATARWNTMRSALERAAREVSSLNREAFAAGWARVFGERVAARDINPDWIESRLQWTLGQIAHLERYRKTPEGTREASRRQEQAQGLISQGATVKALQEQRQGWIDRWQQMKALGDRGAGKFYGEQVVPARAALQKQIEAAQAPITRGWNDYKAQRVEYGDVFTPAGR
jgi:hypothetical protein